MKKRTLNQTWILCLRMWRWVAKNANKGRSVHNLKAQWLYNNKFEDERANCFFCAFARGACRNCPGKLVDLDFNCASVEYTYSQKPVAFYKELLRLNRIRKGKK